MSYANPSQDVGIVDYTQIGKKASEAVKRIDTAMTELDRKQKEAQALLDEKVATIDDTLATENLTIFGGKVSDIIKSEFRSLAGAEALYNMSDQGYRDLKKNSASMKASIDKLAELSLSDIELSKQFDDPALAAFVAGVRSGDFENMDVALDGQKLVYTYNYQGEERSWSSDDILRESKKFEDISEKRANYSSGLNGAMEAINSKVESFAKEGNKYSGDNIRKDIEAYVGSIPKSMLSYTYNELIPDSEKSEKGLPSAYNIYEDRDGNKLSTEEVIQNRENMDAMARLAIGQQIENGLKEYSPSISALLKRRLTQEQIASSIARREANSGKFNPDEWEKRKITNDDLYSGLKSIKLNSYDNFVLPTSTSNQLSLSGSTTKREVYNRAKKRAKDQLMKVLSYAPVEINGKLVPVQDLSISDDGYVELYGAVPAKEDPFSFQPDNEVKEVPLGKFKLDGESFVNAYKHIANNIDLSGSGRVMTSEESEELSWGDLQEMTEQ